MNAQTIIEELNSGEYIIEHSIVEDSDEIIIVGYIGKKENPTGFGRREFALRGKDEQNFFIEGYTEYFKRIIG